jgi:hypothetical protein
MIFYRVKAFECFINYYDLSLRRRLSVSWNNQALTLYAQWLMEKQLRPRVIEIDEQQYFWQVIINLPLTVFPLSHKPVGYIKALYIDVSAKKCRLESA